MIVDGIVFVAGLAIGYFAGRWVQRKRAAGLSAAAIAAEAQAKVNEALTKVKK